MTKGRRMRWHPETGAPHIFETNEDVPEGWLPHHPDDPRLAKRAEDHVPISAQSADNSTQNAENKEVLITADESDKDSLIPATRSEIIAALKLRDIPFRVTAKTEVLYTLLMANIERENETDE